MTDDHPNHDRLVRRALGDVPATDPQAKERARERLRHQMHDATQTVQSKAVGTGRSRAAIFVAFVAAAMVAAAMIVAVPRLVRELEGDTAPSSGPSGPARTAASELQRMMLVAAKQPNPAPSSDATYTIDQQAQLTEGVTSTIDGASYTLTVRSSITGSIEADGSGRRDAVITDVAFASQGDRQSWLEMGSPPLPRVGEHRVERFGPGELLVDLSELSTDVELLRRQIREAGGFGEGPDNLLAQISTLLAQPDAPPELRAALFDLASTIDGVELIPDAVDPLGRRGVGVALDTESFSSSVIVDPTTSSVLAFVDEPRGTNEDDGTTWTAFI